MQIFPRQHFDPSYKASFFHGSIRSVEIFITEMRRAYDEESHRCPARCSVLPDETKEVQCGEDLHGVWWGMCRSCNFLLQPTLFESTVQGAIKRLGRIEDADFSPCEHPQPFSLTETIEINEKYPELNWRPCHPLELGAAPVTLDQHSHEQWESDTERRAEIICKAPVPGAQEVDDIQRLLPWMMEVDAAEVGVAEVGTAAKLDAHARCIWATQAGCIHAACAAAYAQHACSVMMIWPAAFWRDRPVSLLSHTIHRRRRSQREMQVPTCLCSCLSSCL